MGVCSDVNAVQLSSACCCFIYLFIPKHLLQRMHVSTCCTRCYLQLSKNRHKNVFLALSFFCHMALFFLLHPISRKKNCPQLPTSLLLAPPGFASLTSFCRSIFSVRSLSLLPSSTDLFYGALSKTEGVFTAKRCF